MVADQLYKIGRSTPMLRCVIKEEAELIMKELHKGVCIIHIGGRALYGKILKNRYYWPSILQDCARYVNHCEKFQVYSLFVHSLMELLHSVVSPSLSINGGINLGSFPILVGQLKFFIVAVDYFTKWVEAEVVSRITAERVRCFYWRNIICRFGLPEIIVYDNGTQFTRYTVIEFCRHPDIHNKFFRLSIPKLMAR